MRWVPGHVIARERKRNMKGNERADWEEKDSGESKPSMIKRPADRTHYDQRNSFTDSGKLLYYRGTGPEWRVKHGG